MMSLYNARIKYREHLEQFLNADIESKEEAYHQGYKDALMDCYGIRITGPIDTPLIKEL